MKVCELRIRAGLALTCGAADLHARALAQVMERILRQAVLVINKPGAGDVVGTQFVANSGAESCRPCHSGSWSRRAGQ